MEILLELGAKELDQLRKTFLSNNGLSLTEFIPIMFKLLPVAYSSTEKFRILTTKMLIDTFAQVDVNGDGNMSWEEMMAALIDAGSSSGRTAARHSFQFREHESFARTTRHSLRITKLLYIPQLRLLAACEEGKRVVTFYGVSPKDNPAEGYTVVCELDTFVQGEADGGEIFDILYLAEFNILMLAVGDFSIQFWDCRPLQYRMPAALVHGMTLASNTAATAALAEVANRDNNNSERPSSSPSLQFTDGMIQKKRKPLPGLPQDVPSLPSHMDPSSTQDKSKDKKGNNKGGKESKSTKKDDDDDDDDDLDDMGPVKEIIIQISGKKSPVFIRRIHCPSPQRLLCWVPSMGKLLSAGASSEITVWHVVIDRLGFGTWDIRAHSRGMLQVHTQQVTNITLLKDIGLIASSSLDSSICFWGIRGMDDGIGGKRGFKDSPGYKPGKKLPKEQATGGIYLARKQSGTAHKRGVRTLCWLPSVRLLLSGGYETHITVWDMTVDNGTELYRLKGHLKGILSMVSLEPDNSPFDAKANKALLSMSGGTSAELIALKRKLIHYAHVVTVDEGGEFRWWDCSRDSSLMDGNRCLQTMIPYSVSVTKQRYAARSVVCIRYAIDPVAASTSGTTDSVPGVSDSGNAEDAVVEAAKGETFMNGALVLGLGPRWVCFEAVRQDDDRAVPYATLYHDITTNLLAICQQDIRVFSTKTGVLQRVYRYVLPSDVGTNTVVFDGRRRKMIIGCNGGNIVVLNTFNCTVMKPLPRHNADVSGIAYCEEDGLVISAGWDGRIHISDESLPEMDGKQQGLLRRIKYAHGKGAPITALAFDYTLSYIATASTSFSIHLWDYQDAAFQGACIGHNAEITNLIFATPYPVLISGDASGIINVWLVERGKPIICIASLGHDPISVQTPLPITPAEHNIMVARKEMKQKVQETVHNQISKAMKLSHSRTIISRLGSGPSLVPVMHEAITSLTIIPPKKDLAKLMVSPVGKVENFLTQINGNEEEDEVDDNEAENDDNSMIIDVADDSKKDNDYPTLVVGDDIGRISFWNLRHILEAVAYTNEQTSTDSTIPQVRIQTGNFRDRDNHTLLASPFPSNTFIVPSTADSVPTVDNVFRVLRNAIEPLHETKYPCKSSAYHPRKIMKRTGPSPNLVQMTLAPVIDDVPDETVITTTDHASSVPTTSTNGTIPFTATGRKFMTSNKAEGFSGQNNKSVGRNTNININTMVPLSSPPDTAISSTSGFGKLQNNPNLERDAILAGDSWAFDIADIQAADEEEQRLLAESITIMDNTNMEGYDSGGENDEFPSISRGQHRSRTPLPTASTTCTNGGNENNSTDVSDILSLHDDPSTLPSVKIPLIARALGDSWKPSKLVYAHGIFYGGSGATNPTPSVPTDPNNNIVTAEYGVSWRGFPVKNIRVVNTIDISCILTAAEDGTVRFLSLDGEILGAIPISTGRKGTIKHSSSSATPNRRDSENSTSDIQKLLKNRKNSSTDEQAIKAAATTTSANPSAAAAHSLDWLVSLDTECREEILSAAAEDILAKVKEEAERPTETENTTKPSVTPISKEVITTTESSSLLTTVPNTVVPMETDKYKNDERDKLLQQLIARPAIKSENSSKNVMKEENTVRPPTNNKFTNPFAKDFEYTAKDGSDDPTFRTLVELTKAEAEERAHQELLTGGKPKLYRGIDPSKVSTGSFPGSTGGEDDDEDDDDQSKKKKDEDVKVTVEELQARKSEADKRLAKVRSVASRAETQAGGTIVRVNGIVLEDPVRKAKALKQFAKERDQYPSLYAELTRQILADESSSSSSTTTGNGPTDSVSTNTSGGGNMHHSKNNGTMSTFLSANLHKLTPQKPKKTPSKNRNEADPLVSSLGSPPPPTIGTGTVPLNSPLNHAAGGGAAAVRSTKKVSNTGFTSPVNTSINNSSGNARTVERMNKVNALIDMFDSTTTNFTNLSSTVSSDISIQAFPSMVNVSMPVVSKVPGKPIMHLAEDPHQNIVKDIDNITMKEHQSALHSKNMDEIQKTVNHMVGRKEKMDADLQLLQQLAQEDKISTMAAIRARKTETATDNNTKRNDKSVDATNASKKDASRPKSPGKNNVVVSLTPEQYYIMSKRSRIGGQFKRDILSFIELVKNIDKDGSGDVTYEEFVAELENDNGGLAHRKRHLESMFRSIDKEGTGKLSILQLTEVIFPKATSLQRNEIVAYSTYVGPSVKNIVTSAVDRIYSDDTVRQLRDLFNLYDRDGSGTIDRGEMAAVLQTMAGILNSASNHSSNTGGGGGNSINHGPPNLQAQAALEEAEAMLKSANSGNTDGGEEITFEQFVRFMGPAFEPEDDDI